MPTEDLTAVKSHFRFGENWLSFVGTVDQRRIQSAVDSLSRLIAPEEIRGRKFLDIGCGSGLSMLAALQLGADSVRGVDIDPQSAAAARQLLSTHCSGAAWSVEVKSVFDLSSDFEGYDIVHSWGVLHHTGDMERALRTAASLVPVGGMFAVALYRRTPLCGMWRTIKRLYSHSGPAAQTMMRSGYKATFYVGLIAGGRHPGRYVREYTRNRGMSHDHDVHDWMGGYPYESIDPPSFIADIEKLGFQLVRNRLGRSRAFGLWGSGNDEFTFRRILPTKE